MNEVITIAEIEARFPAEWVLIGDPETDESQRLLAGTVLFHASIVTTSIASSSNSARAALPSVTWGR